MAGTSWTNVEGAVHVEIYEHNGLVLDVNDDKEIPQLKGMLAFEEVAELSIEFVSSGHYEPMSMYGGPDHLGWPESGDDERTLEYVSIIHDTHESRLEIDAQRTLFDRYNELVDAYELQ